MIKLNKFFQQAHTSEKFLKSTDFVLSKFVEKDFPLYVSLHRPGLSCQIHKDLNDIIIYSDNGINITSYVPNVVDIIKSLHCEKAIMCATLTINNINNDKDILEHLKTISKENNTLCHIDDIVYFNEDISPLLFNARKKKLDGIGIKQSLFSIDRSEYRLNYSPQIICKNTVELERAMNRLITLKDYQGVKIQADIPYDVEHSESGCYIYSIEDIDIKKNFSKGCSHQINETAILCDFLNCEIKDIYIVKMSISNVRAGNIFNAIQVLTKNFTLVETRNYSSGGEIPPIYQEIRLKKNLSKTFLTEGTRFYYDNTKNLPLIIQLYPVWSGYQANFITHVKASEFNTELYKHINVYAKENNFLKGEKFSVAGEFLDEQTITWEDLKLTAPVKDKIKKLALLIERNDPTLDSRGLIFIGPPGCGKTLSGKLLSKMASTFIWVTAKDFSDMGTSYAMTTAFDLARDLRPSILFMEDIDSYIEYGMIDLLKTELDGMKLNNGVFTILTSNFPENLPEAIIDRPGRFHDIVHFPLPSKDIRKEMLLHFLKEEIDSQTLDIVLKQTEGFSGAHVREICRFAEIIKKEDGVTLSKALIQSLEKLVEQRKLISDFKSKKVSV